MIVSRDTIQDIRDSGMRIACAIDQNLAIAKNVISKQIQKPTSEMIAFYTPSGDVAVTPKKPQEHNGL